MPDQPPKPTFLYVGMPKAASSWMFEVLREHPEIYVPTAKNIEFFDRNYERGIDWYLSHFRAAGGARAIGELSHDYYCHDGACERIHRHLPDAKIIFCLREPGDFLVSSYNFARMHELDRDLDIAGYGNTDTLGQYLRYADNLRRFYKLFPADRIKVLFLDDVRSSPQRVVRMLYEFLGVDPDFRSHYAEQKVNAARQTRSRALTHLAFSTARGLRRLGLSNLVGAVKRNRTVERLLYRSPEAQESGSAQPYVSSLRARCRAEYADLEDLIGAPLPPAWYDAR